MQSSIKPKVQPLMRADLRKDRRANVRVDLALNGRFLGDGSEDHGLLTRNISCGGAEIIANVRIFDPASCLRTLEILASVRDHFD